MGTVELYIFAGVVVLSAFLVWFRVRSRKSIRITKEFQAALHRMHAGENLFITGKAGTGKSTLLRHFVKESKRNLVVVTPTSIAALNVGGMTIHSFFEFGTGVLSPRAIMEDCRKSEIFQSLETLIVDEISMVRADLFECINRSLQVNRGNNEPFGGVQVLLFGDPYQLPPIWVNRRSGLSEGVAVVDRRSGLSDAAVVEHRRSDLSDEAVVWKNRFFFETSAYKNASFSCIELMTVFRQNSRRFIDTLDRARVGKVTQADAALLNSRHGLNPRSGFGGALIATTNRIANYTNKQYLAALPGSECRFFAQVSGKVFYHPAPFVLRLKVGARIVMLRNDQQKQRWVNGTLGIVQNIDDTGITVKLPSGVHCVSPEIWDQHEYILNKSTGTIEQRSVGSFTQYPFALAWAMSIHKSQGQTFDRVVVDFGKGSFAPGQGYVALSRCRSLAGLRLRRRFYPVDAHADPRVCVFMNETIPFAPDAESDAHDLTDQAR